ncbi:alpha/beta hydrolase family protein [Bacillus sp. FJAT-45350]|uniref:alpha/beta hydrolase family protein n=1 Tax=Bacillus sp. FJAT-45350 TaxID=2011014 RepID=UPI000BB7A989|nr:alpha/beta fold hydrolase [Bacillus sp. FJAT-45350]
MTVKNIYFPFENVHLSGVFHYPKPEQNSKKPAIVFAHGFVGSKVGEHRLFVKAARFFAERGYIVFRFDFRGCGESDGDYGDVTVSNQIKQLEAAIKYVKAQKEVDGNDITLIGHSLGGAVSTLTASTNDDIQRLILWSPVARPYKDITRITGMAAVKTANETGNYDYLGFNISKEFFQDLKVHHPLEAISSYEKPFFVLHAEVDEDVPKENAFDYSMSYNKRSQQSKKNYTLIRESDHTFSGTNFENDLFEKTFQWLLVESQLEYKRKAI